MTEIVPAHMELHVDNVVETDQAIVIHLIYRPYFGKGFMMAEILHGMPYATLGSTHELVPASQCYTRPLLLTLYVAL